MPEFYLTFFGDGIKLDCLTNYWGVERAADMERMTPGNEEVPEDGRAGQRAEPAAGGHLSHRGQDRADHAGGPLGRQAEPVGDARDRTDTLISVWYKILLNENLQ